MSKYLVKINRIIAYALLANTIIMLITGYRTRGHFLFLSRGFAEITHIVHLNISFIVLFSAHFLLSIRFALIRKNIQSIYIDVMLSLIGAVLIGIFTLLIFI
jgi:hypothetical protein